MQDQPKLNELGQDLEAFLQSYTVGSYDRPSVTVDIAVFTKQKRLILIQRKNHPNLWSWALPGGFVDMHETLYESAMRELQEETSVQNVGLLPVGVFAEPSRDPRTRIISIAFAALVDESEITICAGDDAKDARLFSYAFSNLGEIEIPKQTKEKYDISLPCTSCGEPLPAKANGVGLLLLHEKLLLSAKLAQSEKLSILMPGKLDDSHGGIASDHALMILKAAEILGIR